MPILNLEVFDMDLKHIGRVLVIGLVLASLISLTGCSRPQSKPTPGKKSEESKSPPPAELKEFQASLDQLYEALKPESPGTAGKSEQGGGGHEQKGQQGDKGSKGEEQKGKAEKPNQQTSGKIDWKKLQIEAEKIHDQWNKFEHKVVSAGAKQENIVNMERELDIIPVRVAAQERSGARMAVNNAAGFLPDFMELYAAKASPDLFRMRVMTRDVVLRVDDGDWATADQDLVKMKTIWAKSLVKMKKASKAESDKAHLAFLDLEGAVQRRDWMLVLIKGNILEKNLDDLIKSQEMKL